MAEGRLCVNLAFRKTDLSHVAAYNRLKNQTHRTDYLVSLILDDMKPRRSNGETVAAMDKAELVSVIKTILADEIDKDQITTVPASSENNDLLQQENTELRETNRRLQEQCAALQNERDALKEQCVNLNSQLEAANAENAKLQKFADLYSSFSKAAGQSPVDPMQSPVEPTQPTEKPSENKYTKSAGKMGTIMDTMKSIGGDAGD